MSPVDQWHGFPTKSTEDNDNGADIQLSESDTEQYNCAL